MSKGKKRLANITHRVYLSDGKLFWVQTLLEDRGAPDSMVDFADSCVGGVMATHLAIAWETGRIIGYWAATKEGSDVESMGTFVVGCRRRRGIGSGLWRFMTNKLGKVDAMGATAVTAAGAGLLSSLQEDYSTLVYDVALL